MMPRLSKSVVESDFVFPEGLTVAKFEEMQPERVIQFGEGNFLRAFADWMIHRLNVQKLFNGRVVVVQPIAEGLVDCLNEQDGLYTLLLRGLKDGKPTEEKEIISSISRGINPYTQWDDYLKCAENPTIEFVISNTTEAGIVFDAADQRTDTPPASFPGKLTAYLYHRFTFFQGDPAKGMVILPCELIDRNGDVLKKVVLQLAAAWGLPAEFAQWIEAHNYFLNTLVDRVVTGYPKDEIEQLQQDLGYEDRLIDAGELFHLWVIEGPQELAKRLPFTKAGLNVIWTEDMTPYRTRKVRILNGAHTASVPAAFLYGLETVGEMMDHAVMGKYVRDIVYQEIVPSIALERQMVTDFADSVMERFQNPYIRHYLISILLNSASKYKARVLPSILEFYNHNRVVPNRLAFSFAALIAVYKDGRVEGGAMQAQRAKGAFVMKDDLHVLEFFATCWSVYQGTKESAQELARQVLANSELWGQNLTTLPGLVDAVGNYLFQIAAEGMQVTVDRLVGAAEDK